MTTKNWQLLRSGLKSGPVTA